MAYDKSKYNNKANNRKSSKSKTNKLRKPSHDPGTNADDSVTSGRINDAAYYFWDDMLKRQITNVSFNQFNGVPNDLGTITTAAGPLAVRDVVPYAMRIELSASPGFTSKSYTAVGNAVNLAALNLYTTLSANNAKTTNYAPQDLTTMILALGSIIEMSSTITRAFGLAYLYNQRNRAFPQHIVETSGFNYQDLMDNFATYRTRFNTIMAAANKIPIPANIPYFKKCADIYKGIYWDMEGSDMAQTYLFTPGTLWLFEEDYSEAGTGLRTIWVNSLEDNINVRKMDWYLTFLDEMVGLMLNSATLNSIYSDIIRVATKESMALYSFEGVSETYVVLPSYVPEIRRWINNATIVGYPLSEIGDLSGTPGNDVLPDPDYNKISYQPVFTYTSPGADLDFYLNFDSSNPSADEIVEATRLASRAKVEYDAESSTYYTTEVALPDHYVNRLLVFGDNTDPFPITNSITFSNSISRALVNFDWAPAIYQVSGSEVQSFVDLNYYTTLTFDYVKRLQDMTYLGLFTIR